MASMSVVVVGGGISGLACARTLLNASRQRSLGLRVVLFEASPRLGGQVSTQKVHVPGIASPVIVEAGAEGFVARSKIFPELAEMCGMEKSQIVHQIRIADNELQKDPSHSKLSIVELEPGVAAQKLGFQVSKEDRGRGIHSFRSGMSDLVENLATNVDVHTSSRVTGIESLDGGFRVSYTNDGSEYSCFASSVVIATPLSCIRGLLSSLGFEWRMNRPLSHNSHVSIHFLLNRSDGVAPKSFAVSHSLQTRFGGLRACSFLHDKFPDRCDPEYWLFRFYFRPSSDDSLAVPDGWNLCARKVLEDVFGCRSDPLWQHFAPWKSSLPIITPEHLTECRLAHAHLISRFRGLVDVCGSETAGAGLDAAATSGHDAAKRVLQKISPFT